MGTMPALRMLISWTAPLSATSAAAQGLPPFARNCDLDVYANEPVQLEITSPDGTLVAWHGIAGLTRVPEAQYGGIAALAALLSMRRRRHAR